MKNLKSILVFTFLFLGLPLAALSEEGTISNESLLIGGNDIVYCAEVMPCDEFGNVIKDYLDSACFSVYQERCLRFKLNDITKKESTCNDTLNKKNRKIRKLKSKIKHLTRR